jgi:hypothetical protein
LPDLLETSYVLKVNHKRCLPLLLERESRLATRCLLMRTDLPSLLINPNLLWPASITPQCPGNCDKILKNRFNSKNSCAFQLAYIFPVRCTHLACYTSIRAKTPSVVFTSTAHLTMSSNPAPYACRGSQKVRSRARDQLLVVSS